MRARRGIGHLRLARPALAATLAALVAGCASLPAPLPQDLANYDEDLDPVVAEMTASMDSPPIEPVEPPLPAPPLLPPLQPAPQSVVAVPPSPSLPAGETPAPAPAGSVASPPAASPPIVVAAAAPSTIPVAPPVPVEDVVALALIADLGRYNGFGPDEVKRELGIASAAFTRDRTDANRVRLAVLYTLSHSNPQDDQRALQLLENVSKSGGAPTPVKVIAAILHVQVLERVKAVRDEQVKGNEAVQKLEALRAMERSLLRDRVRSGGGGGGGGGGGSGGR